MWLRESFSFRQKPSGLFKFLVKAPTYLFRRKLGFLFGDRFLLLTHVGRTSGRTYHTALEVVRHDDSTGEYIVCSGTVRRPTGTATSPPAASIQVRNDAPPTPVATRPVPPGQASRSSTPRHLDRRRKDLDAPPARPSVLPSDLAGHR
jgi:hypothetical protein